MGQFKLPPFREINYGQGLAPAEIAAINRPYYSSQTTYPPRYYQRIAINRTVDAIAGGQRRLLLAMATGTGKTYTACHVAFDKKPLTRRERANNVKKRDFLSKYSGAAREVLEALLDKYMNIGIYELEKTEILKLDPFLKMGKPSKIAGYFGGKSGYLQAVMELKDALYENEAG